MEQNRETGKTKNYYEILEIDKNVSQEEIKKARDRLAKTYHSDRFLKNYKQKYDNPRKTEAELEKDAKDFADKKMKLINEAYEVLSNEQRKADYDAKLAREEAANEREEKERQEENNNQTNDRNTSQDTEENPTNNPPSSNTTKNNDDNSLDALDMTAFGIGVVFLAGVFLSKIFKEDEPQNSNKPSQPSSNYKPVPKEKPKRSQEEIRKDLVELIFSSKTELESLGDNNTRIIFSEYAEIWKFIMLANELGTPISKDDISDIRNQENKYSFIIPSKILNHLMGFEEDFDWSENTIPKLG